MPGVPSRRTYPGRGRSATTWAESHVSLFKVSHGSIPRLRPFGRATGPDPGGGTEKVNSRNSIMIRLMDACIRLLKDKGMNQLFIDGVKGGDVGFQTIGKKIRQRGSGRTDDVRISKVS